MHRDDVVLHAVAIRDHVLCDKVRSERRQVAPLLHHHDDVVSQRRLGRKAGVHVHGRGVLETAVLGVHGRHNRTKFLKKSLPNPGMQLDGGAEEALLQRFGTDTAGIGQALDQLEGSSAKITKQLVLDRFKNRPDEPTFMITDAIAKGDVAIALRRLSDFLVHGHPLVYLAAVESDLKKRSLAAAAPDEETFRSWIGARSSDRGASRMWSNRGRVRESSLRRAQDALVRADRTIKSQPEEVHRVTLERLTVALCRWYGP